MHDIDSPARRAEYEAWKKTHRGDSTDTVREERPPPNRLAIAQTLEQLANRLRQEEKRSSEDPLDILDNRLEAVQAAFRAQVGRSGEDERVVLESGRLREMLGRLPKNTEEIGWDGETPVFLRIAKGEGSHWDSIISAIVAIPDFSYTGTSKAQEEVPTGIDGVFGRLTVPDGKTNATQSFDLYFTPEAVRMFSPQPLEENLEEIKETVVFSENGHDKNEALEDVRTYVRS